MRKSLQAALLIAIATLGGREASAADAFGAIAYSQQTGLHAVIVNAGSRAAAEAAALESCRRSAHDCSAPVWVKNGCVALAVGRGRGFGSGWGSTLAAAEQEAMSVCVGRTTSCAIHRTACTGT